MTYYQNNSKRFKMKESANKLTVVVDKVKNVSEALDLTNKMLEAIALKKINK